MTRQIDILNRSAIIDFDRRRLRRFINLLDANMPKDLRAPSGTLSIVFVDDPEMAELHDRFIGDPSTTDVITFEGDDPESAGEICAGAERAKDWSKSFNNTPSRELSLYVAHGYLHLAGVDDISKEDAAKMRASEAIALEILDKNFRSPIFKFKD